MDYLTFANAETPALIIYVLDVSASMNQRLGSTSRMEVVTEALWLALNRLVGLSTKGGAVSPRYRIAMLAYSDHVYDLLPGIQTIDAVARKGVPPLRPQGTTNTALAFEMVERLLQDELSHIRHCPAPLVCHMTDGEYTGADPQPVARRIMSMQVPDGSVLLENIFISDEILPTPVLDLKQWPGIVPSAVLNNTYAQKLRAMSSTLPESYRLMMLEEGYHLAPDALMMLPGMNPELVELGFVMSTATRVAR